MGGIAVQHFQSHRDSSVRYTSLSDNSVSDHVPASAGYGGGDEQLRMRSDGVG